MTTTAASAPIIRRLSIKRFRSIESMTWLPAPGTNFILGGGDVGKTTILDAIALLLSPTNPSVVPDTDYHRRDEDEGFVIELSCRCQQTATSKTFSKHRGRGTGTGKTLLCRAYPGMDQQQKMTLFIG